MFQSMCKIALSTSVSLTLISGSAFAQSVPIPTSNPVIAGNSGTPKTNASNTANSGTAASQTKPTAAQIQQFQQQMQAEMARTAKEMITLFDQNGDKALNEPELQEALMALSSWLQNRDNPQTGTASSSRFAKGQATRNSGISNSGSSNPGTNAAINTGTGNAAPNSNLAPTDGQPANGNPTSQRVGRRR